MAISHVNTTTGSSTNTGSFSVTKPAGTQAGDVLVVYGASNEGAWSTLPAGFTQIGVTTDGDTTNNFRVYAWYKVCGGSEPASYSFGSTTAASAGAPMVASMSCWRGVDNVNPIANSSIVGSGSSAEPANPATGFTQSETGRLLFARASRSTSEIPTFSTVTSGWTELSDDGDFSGSSVRYAIGSFSQTADTGSGARVEPEVTLTGTDTDNGYFLICLRGQNEGVVSMTLSPVTMAFAGDHRISGTLNTALSPVVMNFNGLGGPPSGTLNTTLSPIAMAFAGDPGVGGPVGMTLGAVSVNAAGSVEPIGEFTLVLGQITCSFTVETRPQGQNVLKVEKERRAFRIYQDNMVPFFADEISVPDRQARAGWANVSVVVDDPLARSIAAASATVTAYAATVRVGPAAGLVTTTVEG